MQKQVPGANISLLSENIGSVREICGVAQVEILTQRILDVMAHVRRIIQEAE